MLNKIKPYDKNEIENFSIKKEQIRRIRTLDEDYDNFWNAVKERFPITVNRTKEYLEWRYLHHPLIDYHFLSLKDENKLKGFAVIRFEDNNTELKAARLVDLVCYEDYDNIILKNVVRSNVLLKVLAFFSMSLLLIVSSCGKVTQQVSTEKESPSFTLNFCSAKAL